MNKKEQMLDMQERIEQLEADVEYLEADVKRLKKEATCAIPDSDYPNTTASIKDVVYLILEDLCLKIGARPFEIVLEPTYKNDDREPGD